MDADLVLRVLSLCVVLAGAETLHGIARTVWLVPRIGKAAALKLSALTGSLLAFGICLLLVPPMGLAGYGPHAVLGGVLAAFMAGFDLCIGHGVMRKPWHKLWPDFNPASGNYLSVGLAVLAVAPMAVHGLAAG